MLVHASQPMLEPASLTVLSRRYGAGAPRVVDLIRRTGGCASPIRLVGESVAVSALTGEVLARRSTEAEAPGFFLAACGNRRASRCPPCSEIYRRDAYFLVAAGLMGSEPKGVSTSVATHPIVFGTFTAPSFGAVHRRVVRDGHVLRCRPGVDAACAHGVSPRCLDRHDERDRQLGQALCSECYDYEASTIWNASLGVLWRRTVTYLPRELAALSRMSVRALRAHLRVTYAKVAEFQARGVAHVHAVIRLDGPDGPETAPTAWATAELLAEAVARAAARVSVTVEGPGGRELVIRWGEQIDVRLILRDQEEDGVNQTAVAGYIAKYATKDAQVAGGLDRPLRDRRQIELADLTDHARKLMASAWSTNPRWAHTFGFRGHFLTKGRRYSTTFRMLRSARAAYRQEADPWIAGVRALAQDAEVVIRRNLRYAGSGVSPAELAIAVGVRVGPNRRR